MLVFRKLQFFLQKKTLGSKENKIGMFTGVKRCLT